MLLLLEKTPYLGCCPSSQGLVILEKQLSSKFLHGIIYNKQCYHSTTGWMCCILYTVTG